ncbi:hypothetical protein NIES2130_28445 [Scytonema sp. HK-05]|nr:hypothetical protein NIES2130_28445 [Scytonema sp. HK-05]
MVNLPIVCLHKRMFIKHCIARASGVRSLQFSNTEHSQLLTGENSNCLQNAIFYTEQAYCLKSIQLLETALKDYLEEIFG